MATSKDMSPMAITEAPGLSGNLQDLRPPPVDYRLQWRGGLGFFLVVLLAIAGVGALVPIDGGVTADGQIAVEFQKKPVQHPNGGVLAKVWVREGERVREGQVVAELASSETSAEQAMSGLREFGLRVNHHRLMAEAMQASALNFPPEVKAQAARSPELRRILVLEQQTFDSRRQRYQAEREALEGTLRRLASEVEASRGTLASRRRQMRLLESDLDRRRSLMASGFVSEASYSEVETKIAEVEALVQEGIANLARTERSLHETQSRLLQMAEERRAAAAEKLGEVNLELDLSMEKRAAATDKEERLKLRSPADGRVVGILVHAAGAVLTPGQALMQVVPDHEKRLIVARIPSHKIDGVLPGLPARVLISGRAHEVKLHGQVETVSADKVDDDRGGGSFYTVRIAIDEQELERSGLASVEVGMPVQVLVTLESRSFFAYLVRPLKKFFDKALRE